jgi:Sulfotransferase family
MPMSKENPNVIILTSGISGSSVLTGLISRAGYWLGDVTFKKEYDTYENQELIDLDLQLFKHSKYTGNYAMEFSHEAIDRITALKAVLDDGPYREFLRKCDNHRPWIWKDPRLWMTIRFWDRLLNHDDCKFILMTRSFSHAWVSTILRRHIRSYKSLKRYEQAIKDSLTDYLVQSKKPYLHITYEQLIVNPETAIRKLNAYLGTSLIVDDLKAIYHQPLYKMPRSSPIDYLKAILIYLKNYSERMDIAESAK